jgi:hypothetical protein
MKKLALLLVIAFLSNLSVMAKEKLQKGTYATITVENPDNFPRKDCPVIVSVIDILSKFDQYKGERIGIFDGKKEISSQFDDLNKDGIDDEVIFLTDLKAKEKRQFTARILPADYEKPSFEKEVYTDLIRKVKIAGNESFEFVTEASSEKDDMYNQMHHHGVAFETDLIAYRLYFDKKQTVDVYGKIKPGLELSQSLWYPTDEQLKKGFGDDILKVSGSVGVGTLKGWNGEKATHFDQMEKRTQRIVATGNLRNVVEIEVKGWQYNKQSIDVKIRYVQYARHRDAEVQVIFPSSFSTNLILSTGVQKMPQEKFFTDKAGLVGVWGTDYPVNDTVKYTKQTVGLGVFVPSPYMKEDATDKVNHLILLQNNGQPFVRYYLTAAAMKEKKGFKSAEEFFNYLAAWKKEKESQPKITVE